ncbi:MAG TPA: response regulator transcription factor [Candidatus Egerieimonas faecigallinarum]|nr:response regulator transcription factor [Candidatus Egerieimonas faecigallinarum]
MIPIYLCDDEEAVRREIRQVLEKEILISGYDMEIVCDSKDPREILETLAENRRKGIYILDVDLKNEQYSGFTLGQAIRRIDSRGFLVYVTAYGELAFDTFRYKLEALDYIVKDDQDKMYQGIRKALEIINERLSEERGEDRQYFTVKFMDTVRHIPVDEILFFETGGKSHRIILHGLKENMDFTGSIRELQKELSGQFVRVHRAYLANVSLIKALDIREKKVVFVNGENCLFSRKSKNELLSLLGYTE